MRCIIKKKQFKTLASNVEHGCKGGLNVECGDINADVI